MDNARAKSAYHSETALSVVSDWTPWIVAAAPALAIGYSLYNHDAPLFLYIPVALAVELAGVLTGHTLTEAREYNALLDTDRRDLRPLGWAMAAYVAAGVTLAVILDIVPDLQKMWPALMPALAVLVYWVTGERIVIRHARARLESHAPEPVNAPAFDSQPLLDAVKALGDTVNARLDALHQQATDNATRLADVARRVDEIENTPPPELPSIADPRIREIIHLYMDDPMLPYRKAAEMLGSSHTEIGNMVKALRATGHLPPAAQPVKVGTNGNGAH